MAGLEDFAEKATEPGFEQRDERQLSPLEAVGQTLSGTRDVDSILEAALRETLRISGVEAGAMFVAAPDTQRLSLRVQHGLPSSAVSYFARMPLASQLLGCTSPENPVCMAGECSDERISRVLLDEHRFGSFAAVPITFDAEVVGVILILTARQRTFEPADIKLLVGIANQIGVVIENARWYSEAERRAERISVLNHIGRILNSTLDLGEVYQQVAEETRRLVPHDSMTVALHEAHQGTVRIYAASSGGSPELEEGNTLSLEGSGPGWVVRHGQPYISNDVPYCLIEDRPLYAEGMRSSILVPLDHKGEVIGSLNLMSRRENVYSKIDVEVLAPIAESLAMAIENARLYERAKAEAEISGALLRVSNAISSSLEVGDIVSTAVRLVPQVLKVSRCAFFRYEDNCLVPMAAYGLNARLERMFSDLRLNLDKFPLLRRISQDRETAVVDLTEVERPAARTLVRAFGLKSVVIIPILHHGEFLGLLVLDQGVGEKPVGRGLTIANGIAGLVGSAMVHASLQAERVERQRLEAVSRAKSQFFASMSHELRTPLSSIIGFSELLLENLQGELNEKQAKAAENILSSGEHLLELVNSILDLSKVEVGKLQLHRHDFELPEVVEQVRMLTQPLATKEQVGLEIECESCLVHADPARVKQVMFNLVSNAIKFTPPGGTVQMRALHQGNWVRVAVVDTGVGIADGDAERIFEEFEQIQGPHQEGKVGTGLGLPLAKKLIELHGGQLAVSSRPGEGSEFVFTLPAAASPGLRAAS